MQSITGDDMQLPRSVQEIADVIGTEQALFLVGQLPRCIAGLPGKRSSRPMLYVPTKQRLGQKHELVRILGWLDAVKLCEAFGGEILQPANCEGIYQAFRQRSIVSMHQEGMAPQAIADLFGMTKTWVKTIIRNSPQEDLVAANDNTPANEPTEASKQAALS